MARVFRVLIAAQGLWLSPADNFLLSRPGATHSLSADAANDQQAGAAATPVTLEKAAMRRGVEEVAIASSAGKAALASAKDASAVRQNLAAQQATSGTKASYLKVKPLLPEARSQLLLVRKFAAEASMHAEHARKVLAGSKHIADEAAKKALEATKNWVDIDAFASAEASSKVDNRSDRLAGAVANAAEPYHIALLRNQKFCEEAYAKAKSAHSSAVKLVSDSKQVALKAQEMQASGMGSEARQSRGMASGMMNEAETLRQWSLRLYGQASSACGTSGNYETMEQQAAANAAATTATNSPVKLQLR